jgi:RNA polymerase sigma-70 factor (ECF subfamily)
VVSPGTPVAPSSDAIAPPDGAVLAAVAAGDGDALATLYDRHRSVAYAIALGVTGSVSAADDVLQDAFLGVWREAARFDPARGSARAWILAIVHHRAIDHVRRRRSTEPLPEPGADHPRDLVVPDVWPEVAGRLDAVVIRGALEALPAVQREVIELAYWGGLTGAQIAERTGAPLGTVKGRMRLGLRALGTSLAEHRDDGTPSPPVADGDDHRVRPRGPAVAGEPGAAERSGIRGRLFAFDRLSRRLAMLLRAACLAAARPAVPGWARP